MSIQNNLHLIIDYIKANCACCKFKIESSICKFNGIYSILTVITPSLKTFNFKIYDCNTIDVFCDEHGLTMFSGHDIIEQIKTFIDQNVTKS